MLSVSLVNSASEDLILAAMNDRSLEVQSKLTGPADSVKTHWRRSLHDKNQVIYV